MVHTLPPVPTTALSISFQYAYACCIALAISFTSRQVPAGQLIPPRLFSPTDTAIPLSFSRLLPAQSGPSASCLSSHCCTTALRRRSKLHNFPSVGASAAGHADDVAALHRRTKCSNALAAAAFVADGAAGSVVAAAPQRLRPQVPHAPCCG